MQTKKLNTDKKCQQNSQTDLTKLKNTEEVVSLTPEWLKRNGAESFDILVWVQPNAKKNALVGCHEGRLKIRITAPAVDNKANKALLVYLAKAFNLKTQQLNVESGETSRQKRVRITTNIEPDWNSFLGLTIENN